MTALDIEPNFCDVIRVRAEISEVSVEVVETDFFWIEQTDRMFDGALFFESFHHCDDHMRLLRALHKRIRPGGRVYFASEPIIANYGTPWGVRMDGEAFWAAHNFGWLELGFNAAYFSDALERTGWRGTFHTCATVPWASVWELQRLEDIPQEPSQGAVSAGSGATQDDAIPAAADEPADHDLARSDLVSSDSQAVRMKRLGRRGFWLMKRPLRAARALLVPGRSV